jgi:hypothetical protein
MSTNQSSYCLIDVQSTNTFNGMCNNGTNETKKYSDDIKLTNNVLYCINNNTPSNSGQPRWVNNISGDNYLRRD